MENASKALLIAGSILIAILLIAVGMKVFNSTSGTTDSVETTMSAAELTMFNKKFLSYVGANKSKAQVVSLLNTIISHNATTNPIYKVNINGSDDIKGKINTLAEGPFNITIDKDNGYSNGRIKDITITYKVSGKDIQI